MVVSVWTCYRSPIEDMFKTILAGVIQHKVIALDILIKKSHVSPGGLNNIWVKILRKVLENLFLTPHSRSFRLLKTPFTIHKTSLPIPNSLFIPCCAVLTWRLNHKAPLSIQISSQVKNKYEHILYPCSPQKCLGCCLLAAAQRAD